MSNKEALVNFYSQKSKHSNYQVLPGSVARLLDVDVTQTQSRYEAERLAYLKSKLDVKGKSVLDIGGNTGYFTFELIDAGAANAHNYEGNKEHSEFVELAANALGLQDKVRVTNAYYPFDGSGEAYDIVLLLNVLHHVGDDYGDKDLSIEEAKKSILEQLNNMSMQADDMVFQLGFNWRGDRFKGLFENGTKSEMIDFITAGTSEHWDITSVGIAGRDQEGIVRYKELNDKNIERDDSMGEFLNRPLFILKSKKANA